MTNAKEHGDWLLRVCRDPPILEKDLAPVVKSAGDPNPVASPADVDCGGG